MPYSWLSPRATHLDLYLSREPLARNIIVWTHLVGITCRFGAGGTSSKGWFWTWTLYSSPIEFLQLGSRIAWATVVGMVGFLVLVAAKRVSFWAGLVILFLALVCIGWAFVMGGDNGGGVGAGGIGDGVWWGSVWWVDEGEGYSVWIGEDEEDTVGVGDLCSCTCTEPIIVHVVLFPGGSITCVVESELDGVFNPVCYWWGS